MKLFLKFTALFEALTGMALIFAPKLMALLLLETTLEETGGQIIAMIAGTAILSIAIICWLMKDVPLSLLLVKTLLFYNITVVAIVFYSVLNFGIKGFGIYLIVGFHTTLAIWSLLLIPKRRD